MNEFKYDEYGILESLSENDYTVEDLMFVMPMEFMVTDMQRLDFVAHNYITNEALNNKDVKKAYLGKYLSELLMESGKNALSWLISDASLYFETEMDIEEKLKEILSKEKCYKSEEEYNKDLKSSLEYKRYCNDINKYITKAESEVTKLQNPTLINKEYCRKHNLSEVSEYDNTKAYIGLKLKHFKDDIDILSEAKIVTESMPKGFLTLYVANNYASLVMDEKYDGILKKVFCYDDIVKLKMDVEAFLDELNIGVEDRTAIFELIDRDKEKKY